MRLLVSISILALMFSSCGKRGYEVRDNGVYYLYWNEGSGNNDFLVEKADKYSFESLSKSEYGKDNNYVFYKGHIIKGADAESFKLLDGGFGIDKNKAFYYGDSIIGSSCKNFEVLDGYFSRDFKDVYYRTEPLGVSDLSNFNFLSKSFLNDRWSTDGHFYWFNNFKVPSTDYENIEILRYDEGFSRDSKNVYYLNRNIKYNEQGDRILDTIDLETFEIIDYIDCRDKFGCINIFHGREHCE